MEALQQWIEKMQGILTTVGYSLAALCVIGLAIVFITGGSRGMEKGKGWAISILIGIGILSFGLALVASLQG